MYFLKENYKKYNEKVYENEGKKRIKSKFAKSSQFESHLFDINLCELVRSFVLTKTYFIYFVGCAELIMMEVITLYLND